MARYKGRPRSKAIERDFPHMVEMILPPGRFANRLDAMNAFCAGRGIPVRHGRARLDADGRDHVRWCFPDPDTADDFSHKFGGRRLIEPMPDKDPLALIEWAKRNIQRD